jgi:hypothetical protein
MAGDRWLRKKISVYASGVTLKYQSEVAGPMIALYAVIRLDRRESFSYDSRDPKRSPRINPDHNSADDASGRRRLRCRFKCLRRP